jgi:hypothetical protein
VYLTFHPVNTSADPKICCVYTSFSANGLFGRVSIVNGGGAGGAAAKKRTVDAVAVHTSPQAPSSNLTAVPRLIDQYPDV